MLPAAGLLTLVGASTAVVLNNAAGPVVAQSSVGEQRDLITAALSDGNLSRSAERAPLPSEAAAEKKVTGHKFVFKSDAVDVHADADDRSPVLATLAPRDKVAVTGEKKSGWTEIMHKDLPRWVKTSGLVDKKPVDQKAAEDKAIGTGPCKTSSGVESGLQPDTVRVHRAVCAKFPSVRSWGGTRGGGGEHGTGQALDIMVDTATGNQIADYVRANARELGASQVIWRQRIWTVQLPGGGWRPMSDRGSPTANHMDHVHVTTYGNRGTS